MDLQNVEILGIVNFHGDRSAIDVQELNFVRKYLVALKRADEIDP